MLLHICPSSIGIKQIFLPFTLHCPLVLLCLLFVFLSQSFPQSLLQSPKFSPWPLAEGWKQAQTGCPCLSRESKQPKAKSLCSPVIKMFHQHTWIQRPPRAQSLIRSPRGGRQPQGSLRHLPFTCTLLYVGGCFSAQGEHGWCRIAHLSCPWAGALRADRPCFYYRAGIFPLILGRENASPVWWWPDFAKPPYSGQPESF